MLLDADSTFGCGGDNNNSDGRAAADAAAAKGGARVEQHVIVAESEFKASECEKCGICVGLASVGVMCGRRAI